MSFRVKIITPIQVDEADLRRRQRRYGERAAPDTLIEIVGLSDGPTALETPDDMRLSEHAVFQEGAKTRADEVDAILIDCIFDPAVEALRKQLDIPVFGPLHTSLPLVSMVAPNFAIVARGSQHGEMFTDIVARYGYSDRLAAIRTLDLTYAKGRQAAYFDTAMRQRLKQVVEEDHACAVVMGSTTMALTDEMAAVAGHVPLFLTGVVTLGIMESLWRDGLLSRGPVSIAPRPSGAPDR